MATEDYGLYPNKDDPICTMCNTPKSGHATFQHPFSDPKDPVSTTQVFGKRRTEGDRGSGRGPALDTPEISVQTIPFDPVLRQVLIDKGVITPDDLLAAQTKIIVVNQMWQELANKMQQKAD